MRLYARRWHYGFTNRVAVDHVVSFGSADSPWPINLAVRVLGQPLKSRPKLALRLKSNALDGPSSKTSFPGPTAPLTADLLAPDIKSQRLLNALTIFGAASGPYPLFLAWMSHEFAIIAPTLHQVSEILIFPGLEDHVVLRHHAPTSKSHYGAKLAVADLFWAAIAPIIAVALRDPHLLDPGDFPREIPATYFYILAAILCAIPALLIFRVSDGLNHLFSVQDALTICAAGAATIALSSLSLFVFTRLEGVPRSTPLIHGLVFVAGLMIDRAIASASHRRAWRERASAGGAAAPQHLRRIIMIGADRFVALTIKLLDHQPPRTTQVIAAVDSRPTFVGRSICGVKIVGLLQDLPRIMEEYAVHGIDINEVWLSDDAAGLSDDVIEKTADSCDRQGVKFVRISEALNLAPSPDARPWPSTGDTCASVGPGNYLKVKRLVDIVMATILLIALMPVTLAAACMVMLDVGTPVIFWQQRVGRNGSKFLLYKFRTYRAPFDKTGTKIPDDQRLSKIGRMMRATRFDEIPQLVNVLLGEMSLIGPRPLLPQDQPADPRIRLLMRPGITGWAQLNGGTIVTPAEKDALDVWYIRHASLWLDLKIANSTLLFALTGESMNHSAVSQALDWRERSLASHTDLAVPDDRSQMDMMGSRSSS